MNKKQKIENIKDKIYETNYNFFTYQNIGKKYDFTDYQGIEPKIEIKASKPFDLVDTNFLKSYIKKITGLEPEIYFKEAQGMSYYIVVDFELTLYDETDFDFDDFDFENEKLEIKEINKNYKISEKLDKIYNYIYDLYN